VFDFVMVVSPFVDEETPVVALAQGHTGNTGMERASG